MVRLTPVWSRDSLARPSKEKLQEGVRRMLRDVWAPTMTGLLATVLAAALLATTIAIVATRPSPLALEALTAPKATIASEGAGAALPAQTKQRATDAYGKLPLSFIPNRGQTNEQVRYYARASGAGFYFTRTKAMLAFEKGKKGTALVLRFLGANPNARLEPLQKQPGRVNYLRGSDRANWQRNIPAYHEIAYRNLWPGIDMVFRGAGGKLEYEFHLRPGSDPSDIRLAYQGADGLSLGASGNLLVQTPLGTLRDSRPRSYQPVGGRRQTVESRYDLTGGSAYGFALGASYDRHGSLVIDPGLVYSTYLGGTGDDDAFAIAVDRAGSAYVTGSTVSPDFPPTTGAFDTSLNGGQDAFVTKLNASGSALDYSTYLGGTSSGVGYGVADEGRGIAVDRTGHAYVTGTTDSPDFPTTAGALDTSLNGRTDAFVTKLNASGSSLDYSTYLGGTTGEGGHGVAVDRRGSAYVAGSTGSLDFPTTAGAFDTSFNGRFDGFVAKLSTSGSALDYSTYLGGTEGEEGLGVALDRRGGAYVTGYTDSSDFPTTAGAFDTSFNGGPGPGFFNHDAFVTKLNASGSSLDYSTYLGGATAWEYGRGVAVDRRGSAYVTGVTISSDFPTTAGAFDTTYSSSEDAFVTKLNGSGSALDYSTYLGGRASVSEGDPVDRADGIAVDRRGSAYVTGCTGSLDFPTTAGAFDTSFSGSDWCDAFVTKLTTSGSALDYSTYLGGTTAEEGQGIAIDDRGNAYVTGITFSSDLSSDFPTTAGAFDTGYNGGDDAFVTKLSLPK
jgi:hypothetical protein